VRSEGDGDESVSELFDRLADGYDVNARENIRYRLPECVYEALSPFFSGAQSMLDVGIGTGLLAILVRRHPDIRIVGVDCSSRMLDVCARTNRADEVHCVDVAEHTLPFEAAAFDIVVACGVTEFVSPLDHLIMELTRVTRRSGVVAVTYEIAPEGVSELERRDGPVPCYAYGGAHVGGMLRRAGLEALSAVTVEGYVLDGAALRHGIVVSRPRSQ